MAPSFNCCLRFCQKIAVNLVSLPFPCCCLGKSPKGLVVIISYEYKLTSILSGSSPQLPRFNKQSLVRTRTRSHYCAGDLRLRCRNWLRSRTMTLELNEIKDSFMPIGISNKVFL